MRKEIFICKYVCFDDVTSERVCVSGLWNVQADEGTFTQSSAPSRSYHPKYTRRIVSTLRKVQIDLPENQISKTKNIQVVHDLKYKNYILDTI